MLRLSPRARWILLLIAACAVVYARTLSYGFIAYDDDMYVYDNRVVVQGLSWASVRWAFQGQHIGHYHPLTWLSHLLDVSLFGVHGGGHHATNLVLHLGCTLLVFLFFQRATGQTGRSGVVALLFAVHPLHVEPVAWISSRKDVLSTLFWMSALVAYESYRRAPSVLRYLGVALAYVAGLLSKPMVVTLPVILLLLDYWPLGRVAHTAAPPGAGDEPTAANQTAPRRSWPWLVAEKVPLLLLAALSSRITMHSASEAGVMQAQNLSLLVRIENSLVSYVLYLRQLVLPVDLAVHHERFMSAPSAAQLGLSVAILAGVSLLAFYTRRRHPFVVTGWLFYLISFLPVIGLLQYGGHSTADRYAYVPSLGAFVIVVWGMAALFERLPNGAFLRRVVTLASMAVFALLSSLQVGYWESAELLFQHALDVEPNSPRIHNVLGVELVRRGAVDEAAQHFSRAIELAPWYPNPMNNLAVLLARKGRTSEAIAVYRKLLRLDTNDPKSHAKTHANLASALANEGQTAEAETHYRTAIRLDPDYLSPRINLSHLLANTGRMAQARSELEAAIALYPQRADLRAALAELIARPPPPAPPEMDSRR